MGGLYIHIPFCSRRCHYCDFFSTLRVETITRYTDALCAEIADRKDYLSGNILHTVYFGGGTPSLLPEKSFERIFATIGECFELKDDAEVTLEANPDDLTPAYAARLGQLPFNRISIGVQSFDDGILSLLNRRHTSAQAVEAVKVCRECGFSNISIDLMYALPGQSLGDWGRNIDCAIALEPEHISAYMLTYEEGTVLYDRLRKGEVEEADEELGLKMYETLIERLTAAGYIHYEISNFAKEGYFSKHNSSYWKGMAYLGVGASAHSYNGVSRQWNVSSLDTYLTGEKTAEVEYLDTRTRYNDYILTRLRCMWGIDLKDIRKEFGDIYLNYCLENTSLFKNNGFLIENNGIIILSKKGLFISDGIISELLVTEKTSCHFERM